MGLKEKRAIKQVVEEFLPQTREVLEQATGKPLALDIDWPTFNVADEINLIQSYCLRRLEMAFDELCADANHKRLILDNIDAIVIKNIPQDSNNTKQLSAADRTFTLAIEFSEYADGSFSDYAISEFLTQLKPQSLDTRVKIKLPKQAPQRVKIQLK